MKKKTSKTRKRRLKKWVKVTLRLIIFALVLFFIGSLFYKRIYNHVKIKDIYLDNNKLHIKINSKLNKNIYYLLTKIEE